MDAGPRGEEGEDGRSRCEEGKEDLGCGWRCVAIRAPGGDVELQSDLGVWSSELRWGWRQKFPGCRVQHSVDPNFASRGHGFRFPEASPQLLLQPLPPQGCSVAQTAEQFPGSAPELCWTPDTKHRPSSLPTGQEQMGSPSKLAQKDPPRPSARCQKPRQDHHAEASWNPCLPGNGSP